MRNVKLLFVDDEATVCEEFGLFLKRKGFEVETAHNSLQALRKFNQDRPDLVLTDYHMPQINGLQLLKEIKSSSPDTPVILISGKADMRTAMDALKENAFDFLEKPVDSADLLRSVHNALKRKQEVAAGPVVEKEDNSTYHGPIRHSKEGENGEISVIHIYRALDEYAKKKLSESVEQLLAERALQRQVVVVLKHANYINNIGLNFLIETDSMLKARGHRVVYSNMNEPVFKYIKMLGYDDYFRITSSKQEAIQLVRSKNDG